jgi:hypothetical protein
MSATTTLDLNHHRSETYKYKLGKPQIVGNPRWHPKTTQDLLSNFLVSTSIGSVPDVSSVQALIRLRVSFQSKEI